MSAKIPPNPISRRTVFSIIGGALGLALTGTMLAVSEAEAQTPGMERRQDRRRNRQDRRDDRRDNRQDRREDRRDNRQDRRDMRY